VTSRKRDSSFGFVDIRLGAGAGRFKPALTLDVNAASDMVIPADTDGDGKLDLVLSGWFSTGRLYFVVMKSPCR
jgi:hypothetical protein